MCNVIEFQFLDILVFTNEGLTGKGSIVLCNSLLGLKVSPHASAFCRLSSVGLLSLGGRSPIIWEKILSEILHNYEKHANNRLLILLQVISVITSSSKFLSTVSRNQFPTTAVSDGARCFLSHHYFLTNIDTAFSNEGAVLNSLTSMHSRAYHIYPLFSVVLRNALALLPVLHCSHTPRTCFCAKLFYIRLQLHLDVLEVSSCSKLDRRVQWLECQHNCLCLGSLQWLYQLPWYYLTIYVQWRTVECHETMSLHKDQCI